MATLLDRLKLLFENATLPNDVVKVFNFFADLWGCIPFLVRVLFICCFGFAALIAILKILL